MAQDENGNEIQPKYVTHEDLNGFAASQKRDMQSMMKQQQTQFQELMNGFNGAFGPKAEAQAIPSKAVLAEDSSLMKSQMKILLEEREQYQAQNKKDKMEKTLREGLQKHGINSRSDLALKYLQDQVSYDEDGQLVMKFEVAPGVHQPLPIGEAIARFAQTDHGKFLSDPKDVRGSGVRTMAAPGSQANATITSMITGNSAEPPVFKDLKDVKAYATSFLAKPSLKY